MDTVGYRSYPSSICDPYVCVCVFWRRHAPHSTLGLYGVLGCTNSRRRKPYRMTCTCTLGPDFFCCISNLLTRLIGILFFWNFCFVISRRNCPSSFNSVFDFNFFFKQLLQLADIFFNSMGKTVEFVWSGERGVWAATHANKRAISSLFWWWLFIMKWEKRAPGAFFDFQRNYQNLSGVFFYQMARPLNNRNIFITEACH